MCRMAITGIALQKQRPMVKQQIKRGLGEKKYETTSLHEWQH